MKIKLLIFLMLFSTFAIAKDLYQFTLKDIQNKELPLSQFKNKVILIVNIATRCGFTGQLDDLEKTYQKFKDKDFVIIGIPSNDFAGQTPEENVEVAKFCRLKYGVTFNLTEKMIVKGEKKVDLYKYLIGLTDNDEIGWNFTKFLFDKKGQLVKRYSSFNNPSDEKFIKDIEKLL